MSDPFNDRLRHSEPCTNSFEDDFVPSVTVTLEHQDQNHERNILVAPPPWQELQNIHSDVYVASLEAKLKKIQNRNSSKKPNSKQMLQALCDAKLDSTNQLVSGEQIVFADPSETGEVRDINNLKRWMMPEQALSAEEIQILIERDYLKAATQHMYEDDSEVSDKR